MQKRAYRLGLSVLTALILGLGAGADTSEERCFLDGVRRAVPCGTVERPLYDGEPVAGGQDETLDIFYAVIPATSSAPKSDPIVFLVGGPGQAASEHGAAVRQLLAPLRRDRDIVLVDQRGTGRSNPLECEFGRDAISLADTVAAVRACRDTHDVDTRAFNLEAATADLEAVRQHLRYDRLNLFGISYGTRAAVHYYRRFPENVRTLTLDGVAPADLPLFETSSETAGRAMTHLMRRCAERAECQARFGDLEAKLTTLINRAAAGELVYSGADSLSGEAVSVLIEPVSLIESLRTALYAPTTASLLPLVIDSAYNGDLEPYVALGQSTPGAGLYIGMSLSYLCGEDVVRTTANAARSRGQGSFAGDSFYKIWSAWCSVWDYGVPGQDLPSDLHQAAGGDVPTLLISGYLDPITPPSNAEHLAKTFPNSAHFVAPATGHNASGVACAPAAIVDFITHADPAALDLDCTSHLAPPLILIDQNGRTTTGQGEAP